MKTVMMDGNKMKNYNTHDELHGQKFNVIHYRY